MKAKRFFPLLVFGCLLMAVSCQKDRSVTKNTLDYLLEDYATVVGRFPDAKGHFVEAQYKLNAMISEKDAKDLRPVGVLYVYNLGWDTDLSQSIIIYHERDFENGLFPAIIVEYPRSPWMEDKLIPNFNSFISLEQAIANVKKAGIQPQTAYVTLRYPLIEFDKGHALYVFGGTPDREKHVMVDAISGEVYELD